MLPMARRTWLVGRSPWIRLVRLSWWIGRVEPVELHAQRFGYQPRCFRWRGMLYRVYRIERVWEQSTRGNRAARRYFIVRCADEQRYTLFQDLTIGTWHMVHGRWW